MPCGSSSARIATARGSVDRPTRCGPLYCSAMISNPPSRTTEARLRTEAFRLVDHDVEQHVHAVANVVRVRRTPAFQRRHLVVPLERAAEPSTLLDRVGTDIYSADSVPEPARPCANQPLQHHRLKEPERSARLGEIADDLQHATEPHRVEDLDRPAS